MAEHWPLLRQAVSLVGHPQIRNRGTVGGSVAHADPAAELPVALTALDARFHGRSRRGARTLARASSSSGPLTTALEDDELLIEIEVPPLPAGARTAFVEHARTHGDFAIAGAAVVVAPGSRRDRPARRRLDSRARRAPPSAPRRGRERAREAARAGGGSSWTPSTARRCSGELVREAIERASA